MVAHHGTHTGFSEPCTDVCGCATRDDHTWIALGEHAKEASGARAHLGLLDGVHQLAALVGVLGRMQELVEPVLSLEDDMAANNINMNRLQSDLLDIGAVLQVPDVVADTSRDGWKNNFSKVKID